MTKRKFLALSAIASVTPIMARAQESAGPAQEVHMDGVSFQWRHQDGRFIGSLSAPTNGWIAVGINKVPGIKGTHFVMASVSEDPPRFEEHFAIAPDHLRISDLGWPETAILQSGQFRDGASTLTFVIPSSQLTGSEVSLTPGTDIHLMLAWSHNTDFHHHSAWRRHLLVSL